MANRWKIDRTQAKVLTLYIQDGNLSESEQDIGNFILLLRAFTYEEDATAREGLLQAAEEVLTPFIASVDRVIDNLCERRLRATRKAEVKR